MKCFKSILIFLIPLMFLSACTKKPPPANYVWTGQPEILNWVPVCIVWYKKAPDWAEGAWRPYKSFSQIEAHEMRKIIKLLAVPEIKDAIPNLKTEDKLSLIFYNGRPGSLTVREVYFEIKDKTFIGPLGKSDKLAEILFNQQEVPVVFYYPYNELGSMHYWDDFERILKIQQEQQIQAEKEAEARRKIKEPNQPK